MKKVLVHLSLLCLMAALVLPLAACKKEEMNVEDNTVASEPAMSEPAMTEPAMTDMGTMGTDMGTGMGTEMGTQMTEPPPAQ
jgi:ABC-type oligopeptide transport system substrate-binding subunit